MSDKICYTKYVVSNNIDTVFYSNNKFVPNSKAVFVYYNGLLLVSGDDYIEKDEHNIELTFEPYKGDIIIISPIASSTIGACHGLDKPELSYDEFTVTTTNKLFKLKNKYVPKTNTIRVFLNGNLLGSEHYQEVNSETIKILCKLEIDDNIKVVPTVKVEKKLSVLREGLINKNKWSSYEEFTVEKEERVFKLSHRYTPGINGILVYHNGVVLDSEYYTETDEQTITLKFFPEKNDVIVIVPTIDPNIRISDVNGDIVGNTEGSLFYRYGDKQYLLPNQNYTLKIVMDGKEKTFSFTSQYAPFYSTSKIIRMDLLEVLDEVGDDVINFTVWQNSKLVEELHASAIKDKLKIKNVKAWVRFKTELDLINSIYINIATRAGSHQRTLGNMQVSKSIKIPYLDELLKMINRKLDAEEVKLSGVKAVGRSMRKANRTDYPISPERRSF